MQMMATLAPLQPFPVDAGLTAHGRFVDKSIAIRKEYGTACEVIFIVGFDTVVRIFDPKYYQQEGLHVAMQALFSEAQVAFAQRDGFTANEVATFTQRPDVAPYADRLHYVQIDDEMSRVSSTKIRSSLAQSADTLDLPAELAEFKSIYRFVPL
eukprot:TRINITY_DN5861_c0_g1_i1.p1 TRINITY_DN5861_c0_g1~~TRINITY_DN5861_c0_g1_i1.p1  ORF type:complete len:154 (-),score=38.31 TRINITY_DN5861_c0_g1_i1:37-498(-)